MYECAEIKTPFLLQRETGFFSILRKTAFMIYEKIVPAIKVYLTIAGCFSLILLLICFAAGTVYAARKGNTKIRSFTQAKRILIREVYRAHQTTFYCGSQYTQGKYVIHNNGYIPKRKSSRARRLEWEHVVSVESFGYKFSEWRDGHPECLDTRGRPFKGQNCAEKVNAQFRYMQSDLYNLVPAIGEIRGLKSNYAYGMIPQEKQEFGDCDIEIAFDRVEPPSGVRGDIARIYLYMDWAYPGYDILSNENKSLFKAWDKNDPVDEWECERARRIEEIQKNENPFVKKACAAEGLW
jgi:deoxyribonuclease-1